MNLVSEIVDALGPTIVSRVASSLGFDQAVTQKAVNAAVPGLLAALISLVSKPQGASKLADAVGKQPAGILSSLAEIPRRSRDPWRPKAGHHQVRYADDLSVNLVGMALVAGCTRLAGDRRLGLEPLGGTPP